MFRGVKEQMLNRSRYSTKLKVQVVKKEAVSASQAAVKPAD